MTAAPEAAVPFFTVDEFATMLRVARSTMWGLVGRGEIRSVKVGRSRRIPATEIDRLMREGGIA